MVPVRHRVEYHRTLQVISSNIIQNNDCTIGTQSELRCRKKMRDERIIRLTKLMSCQWSNGQPTNLWADAKRDPEQDKITGVKSTRDHDWGVKALESFDNESKEPSYETP